MSLNDSTVDLTPLIRGGLACLAILAVICAAVILGIWLRASRKRASAEIDCAISDLETLIRIRYLRTHQYTDPSHYQRWRLDFIAAVNDRFGERSGIWQKCKEAQELPPIDVATGELITSS